MSQFFPNRELAFAYHGQLKNEPRHVHMGRQPKQNVTILIL